MKLWNEKDKSISRIAQWHLWFAWFPGSIPDQGVYWLQFVHRKGTLVSTGGGDLDEYEKFAWEYKLL